MRNFNRGDRKDRKGFGQRDSGNRSMHQATCDKCGQDCEVPFRPTGDKPVYCSNCFEKNKSSDFGRPNKRDFGKFNRSSGEMFTAVCDKCGNKCEVPFRPTAGKPVYCRDCFGQNRGDGNKNANPAKEQFEIINSKLDKILSALNQEVKKAIEAKPKEKTLAVIKKKVEKVKKVAKKTVKKKK